MEFSSYLEQCSNNIGLPDRGLVSTEFLIFHLIIRVQLTAALDETCMGPSGAETFFNTHILICLQANRLQVRMITFSSHLPLCVSTFMYAIRPKPLGYVDFLFMVIWLVFVVGIM